MNDQHQTGTACFKSTLQLGKSPFHIFFSGFRNIRQTFGVHRLCGGKQQCLYHCGKVVHTLEDSTRCKRISSNNLPCSTRTMRCLMSSSKAKKPTTISCRSCESAKKRWNDTCNIDCTRVLKCSIFSSIVIARSIAAFGRFKIGSRRLIARSYSSFNVFGVTSLGGEKTGSVCLTTRCVLA